MHFATARGYDDGRGRRAPDRARRARRTSGSPTSRPAGCVAVLAVVPPDKLVLCADEFILQDERDKVVAVAARAASAATRRRSWSPTTAVERDDSRQVPDPDRDGAVSASSTRPRRRWTAGATVLRRSSRPGRGAIPQSRRRRDGERPTERGCAGTPAARIPAGPTSASTSTRPARTSRSDELARDPGVVEQPQRPAGDLGRGGVAEVVRDDQVEMPVVVRVRLRVAGDQQRRRRRRSGPLGRAGRARGRSSPTAVRRGSPGIRRQAA